MHGDVVFHCGGIAGLTYVGFEDLFGGGDKDDHDHRFALTMAAPAVPEPRTYALLPGGFGALGLMVRRRGR